MKSAIVCLLMTATKATDKIVGTSRMYCSYYDGAKASSRCAPARNKGSTSCCGKIVAWDVSGF